MVELYCMSKDSSCLALSTSVCFVSVPFHNIRSTSDAPCSRRRDIVVELCLEQSAMMALVLDGWCGCVVFSVTCQTGHT